MSDAIIQFENVYQRYPVKGGIRTVLSNINLTLSRGEFVTVVGPTGCGKSTMLRLILGSEHPAEGQVLFNGEPIKEPDRDRGVVFQHYSLFPNRTVRQNVTFGLELEAFSLLGRSLSPRKNRLTEFRTRADEYLERVGLLEHADKYPHQLSGGMRQRAAIAQAMVMSPQILLMDEPHGALDVGTREEMQVFVLEQWQRENQTIVFVTHDLEEAIFLGTRIIVISQYYSNADGSPSDGSKIVKDVSIGWPMPRPTAIKHSEAFNKLAADIRHEGLDPDYLQRIEDFDQHQRESIDWSSMLAWRDTERTAEGNTEHAAG